MSDRGGDEDVTKMEAGGEGEDKDKTSVIPNPSSISMADLHDAQRRLINAIQQVFSRRNHFDVPMDITGW